MNNDILKEGKWSENVILADADYIDKVAFDLIVNFERMIGRRINQADMARWIDCIALDGGIREGENNIQVVLIHDKKNGKLDNFAPSDYANELDGKAFKDNLGEFVISALPVEDIVSKDDLFIDALSLVCEQKEVKRVMVIPDTEKIYDQVRQTLHRVDDDKRITVFSMQPMQGGNFRQEILGYSLMSALGIRADEIK
ncbi:MAG: hypothetical protein Q4D41_11665 [Prevotellaceae bacterium]|nr:hypothetical protein [Prevotellaceae bacterium]